MEYPNEKIRIEFRAVGGLTNKWTVRSHDVPDLYSLVAYHQANTSDLFPNGAVIEGIDIVLYREHYDICTFHYSTGCPCAPYRQETISRLTWERNHSLEKDKNE